MAVKKQDSINLIDIFSEFKELKNIDRQTFINVLEDSFRNVITKMYGTDAYLYFKTTHTCVGPWEYGNASE